MRRLPVLPTVLQRLLLQLGVVVALVVAFKVNSTLRAGGFGFNPWLLLLAVVVTSATVAPMVLLARRAGARRGAPLLFAYLLTVGLPEMHAWSQERLFVWRHRDAPRQTEVVVEARWWPLSHVLVHDPSSDEWRAER